MAPLHPTLNACLNGLSACFLVAGFLFIRKKNVAAHRLALMTALGISTLFLISYVVYHFQVGATRFQGDGWIRPVYFILLISHTVLATAIVPLVLITLTKALRGNIPGHRRWARWTFPLWLYVSLTGVIIYFMIYWG